MKKTVLFSGVMLLALTVSGAETVYQIADFEKNARLPLKNTEKSSKISVCKYYVKRNGLKI